MARSFANDSRLRRDNLIETLDARLLWSKSAGYDADTSARYSEFKLLRDYDFKMSIVSSYSKEEERFYREHGRDAAFVIMPFRKELDPIYDAIRETFSRHGIRALKASEREYTNELFSNMKVYMDCCKIAVAVFDRNSQGEFNPNVALEVGYMIANDAKICVLKDARLTNLPTDLISRLYKEYNPNDISGSISTILDEWITDNLY